MKTVKMEMEIPDRIPRKNIHLPVRGHESSALLGENYTIRAARPIAELYTQLRTVHRMDVDAAITICKQAHMRILNLTPGGVLLIPRVQQKIRSEIRLNVGISCELRINDIRLDGVVSNLSLHGLRIKPRANESQMSQLRVGDTVLVRLTSVEREFRIPNGCFYKIIQISTSHISLEMEPLMDNSEYKGAIKKTMAQTRLRHRLDQNDAFVLFLQACQTSIREYLQASPTQNIAFHLLRTGARVYSTSMELPVSSRVLYDQFITIPMTSTISQKNQVLKQHSPVLYNTSNAICHQRLRCMIW